MASSATSRRPRPLIAFSHSSAQPAASQPPLVSFSPSTLLSFLRYTLIILDHHSVLSPSPLNIALVTPVVHLGWLSTAASLLCSRHDLFLLFPTVLPSHPTDFERRAITHLLSTPSPLRLCDSLPHDRLPRPLLRAPAPLGVLPRTSTRCRLSTTSAHHQEASAAIIQHRRNARPTYRRHLLHPPQSLLRPVLFLMLPTSSASTSPIASASNQQPTTSSSSSSATSTSPPPSTLHPSRPLCRTVIPLPSASTSPPLLPPSAPSSSTPRSVRTGAGSGTVRSSPSSTTWAAAKLCSAVSRS